MIHLRDPAGPVLTPASAQRLIETFADPLSSHLYSETEDPTSSSSQSPDSLYSTSSPMFPDTHPFEYDEFDHEEIDAGEYEALMSHDDGLDEGEEVDPSSPAWGRWPHHTTLGGPGWTPLPTHGGLRSGSIISISPRGSVSNSRRGSAPVTKLSNTDLRRNSAGDSLGLMDHRRRSSAKSTISPRRRSSVMSNGSIFDPVEEERLRHFARLDVLARRFSELVEIVSPCPGADEGFDDVTRAREMISRWSPYSTETDVSEVRTMSLVPTPQIEPPVPALLSNFPLSSVAREYSLNTPDELAVPVFSRTNPRAPIEYTPPPPVEPVDQLRRRSRPGLVRALTDFTFPPRPVVPLPSDDFAAATRPAPRRVVSTPHLSQDDPPQIGETQSSAAKDIIPRRAAATGSFPLARSHPIGLSRLRESTRRPSTSSEAQQSRRPSIVAERRMSIVEQGSSRALSSRKSSRDVSPKSSRKASLDPSQQSLVPRRKSSAGLDLRRESLDPLRRSSATSRTSSIVSLGEYRYLAAEIDTPVPPIHTVSPVKPDSLRTRRNAPPAIVLPPYQFPLSHPTAALSSPGSATPRYHPLDTFFGKPTPGLISSGLSPDRVSPDSDLSSPRTPGLHRSVLDRGRPVASPEFQDSFPLRSSYPSYTPSGPGPRPANTTVRDSHIPRKSPSYQFPVMPATSPKDSESARRQFIPVTQAQLPLKSILIKHTPAPVQATVTIAGQEASRGTTSASDSERDIQVFLRARRELKAAADTAVVVETDKARPAMTRHSSFTRLFHRAKSQSSPST